MLSSFFEELEKIAGLRRLQRVNKALSKVWDKAEKAGKSGQDAVRQSGHMAAAGTARGKLMRRAARFGRPGLRGKPLDLKKGPIGGKKETIKSLEGWSKAHGTTATGPGGLLERTHTKSTLHKWKPKGGPK